MPFVLSLQDRCVRLRLRRGAELLCEHGCLWLTFEPRRAAGASPDVILLPGQRHAVAEDGACFLTPLHRSAATPCQVDRSRERRGGLWRWLERCLGSVRTASGAATSRARRPPSASRSSSCRRA